MGRDLDFDPEVMEAPGWCPLHPGALVAVPVPPSIKAQPYDEKAWHAKEAWNNCRDQIIDSARSLGQEIADDR